jgi:superfamily II DNA/RNA helicase
VQVEVLAKQVLQSPIEIQVGGRSVVNSDISQFVEIRPEEDRFLRLLEILGEWYERGKILIFVSSQDQCDNLFRDLIKVCGRSFSLLRGYLLLAPSPLRFFVLDILFLEHNACMHT